MNEILWGLLVFVGMYLIIGFSWIGVCFATGTMRPHDEDKKVVVYIAASVLWPYTGWLIISGAMNER